MDSASIATSPRAGHRLKISSSLPTPQAQPPLSRQHFQDALAKLNPVDGKGRHAGRDESKKNEQKQRP